MLNEPATVPQIRAIAKLARIAGISYPLEEKPMTLREARNLLFYLTGLVRKKGERNAKQIHPTHVGRDSRVQKQSRFNL
jgi:hypothetical protein